jgi:hypothetical protein
VISKAHRRFWAGFEQLPQNVQELARKQYRIWQRDPFHPSMHFKELKDDIWSVRIGQHYRALGRRSGEMIVWFWIGTHEEYNKLVR